MEIPSPEQMLGAGSRGDSNAEAGKPSSTNICRVSRTVTSPWEGKHDVNAERSVTTKRQKKRMMDKKENLNCLPHYVHYLIPLLVAKRKKKEEKQWPSTFHDPRRATPSYRFVFHSNSNIRKKFWCCSWLWSLRNGV